EPHQPCGALAEARPVEPVRDARQAVATARDPDDARLGTNERGVQLAEPRLVVARPIADRAPFTAGRHAHVVVGEVREPFLECRLVEGSAGRDDANDASWWGVVGV